MAKKGKIESLRQKIESTKSLLKAWGTELKDAERDIHKRRAEVGPMNAKLLEIREKVGPLNLELYHAYDARDNLKERIGQQKELLERLKEELYEAMGG